MGKIRKWEQLRENYTLYKRTHQPNQPNSISLSKNHYLALQKEGKTYVFSKLGPQLTQSAIDQDKSPSVFPFMELLVRKSLYISPYKMEELCNLLGGGYTLHEYAEKSYEGYVTARSQEHYSLTTDHQSTEQVGEQLLIHTVTLTTNKELLIVLYGRKSNPPPIKE